MIDTNSFAPAAPAAAQLSHLPEGPEFERHNFTDAHGRPVHVLIRFSRTISIYTHDRVTTGMHFQHDHLCVEGGLKGEGSYNIFTGGNILVASELSKEVADKILELFRAAGAIAEEKRREQVAADERAQQEDREPEHKAGAFERMFGNTMIALLFGGSIGTSAALVNCLYTYFFPG